MRRMIVAIALCAFSMTAWGMGSLFVPAKCPASGPPKLVASGPSPDGEVCLGQSVRDSRGDVWTFARISGTSSQGVILGGFPASGSEKAYIVQYPNTRATAARISGGRFEIAIAGAPNWFYYAHGNSTGWWNVDQPIPEPGPALPPCAGPDCKETY